MTCPVCKHPLHAEACPAEIGPGRACRCNARQPARTTVAEARDAIYDLAKRVRDGEVPLATAPWPSAVLIDYTNYRGDRRRRLVQPIPGTLTFRETPHHKPAQWVFDALDLEREDVAQRTFSLATIHGGFAPWKDS